MNGMEWAASGGVTAPPTTPMPPLEGANWNNDTEVPQIPTDPFAKLSLLESMKHSASLKEDYLTAHRCKEEIGRLQNEMHTRQHKLTLCQPLPCNIFERQLVTKMELRRELTDEASLEALTSPAQIVTFWSNLKAKLAAEYPSVPNMVEGLAVLQMYRKLCGAVPYDTRLSQELIDRAHKGASLIEKCGIVSKMLDKPDSWDADLYSAALQGLNGSLAVRQENGKHTIATALHALMNDSGSAWTSLPHRRWLLTPGFHETGFGSSGATTAIYTYAATQNYHLMRSYTAFPPPGYFPLEWLDEDTTWCCILNPMHHYQTGQVEVTISPIVSQDGAYQRLPALQLKEGVYVNTEYFGLGNAVVFKPEGLLLADGSCYEVVIKGLQRINTDGMPGGLAFEESILADGSTKILLQNTASGTKYSVKVAFSGVDGCPPVVVPLSPSVCDCGDGQYRVDVDPGDCIPFVRGVWTSYTKACASGPPSTLPFASTPETISYVTMFFRSGLPATNVDTTDLG